MAKKAKPLYEFGLAVGSTHIPDYPAANEGRIKSIAVPTALYRGLIFRSDKKGTRARFWKFDKVDIDLSLGASLPSSSDDNEARKGMNDLDFLLELGPRVNVDILDDGVQAVQLEFPLRAVASTNGSFTKHRGFRFTPQIDYRRKLNNNFRFSTSFKLNYGSETLNDYFYQVDGSDVNSTRSAHNGKAGYIGRDMTANILYRYESLTTILGVRYSNYDGSANQNSSLFKAKENSSIFIGFNYFFYQSDELAKD